MVDDEQRHIGHVDHGKTTLTASIFSTPEFERLRKRVHEELAKPYSTPLVAAYRGGKAARKMQRRKR